LGFQVISNYLVSGTCPECHLKIPGVWS
jgi:hypothetical protein